MKQEHVLYTPKDFTQEEIDRDNPLAVAVIKLNLSVCKKCGQSGLGLKFPCSYKQQFYRSKHGTSR